MRLSAGDGVRDVTDLQTFYAYATQLNGLTGLVGKLPLALVLAALVMGNRRPGQRVFGAVLAVQALSAAYVVWAVASDDSMRPALANAAGPVALLSGVLAVGFGWLAWRGAEDWRIAHPTQPAITVLAWAAVAWAFWFPVFSGSAAGAVFFSPTSVLPHATLMVASALAWMSARGGDQGRNWFVAGTAAGLALYDVALGREWSSLVLLALAIGILVEQRLQAPAESAAPREADPGVDPSLALYEAPDDAGPAAGRKAAPASARPPAPKPAPPSPAGGRKSWKLK